MNRVIITNLLSLFILSNNLHSQTSGPTTPEVQKFTPSSAKDMVNLFTGDLNYNINLLELDGGYPINLSYSSALGMTEEASSVGFAWQINIGRINRTVRGLPDDFNGEPITRQLYQQEELNIGIGAGVDAELFGFPIRVGATSGVTFSNMRGIDINHDLSASITQNIAGVNLSGGLTLGSSTGTEGATISPNVGLKYGSFSLGLNTKISSTEGLRYLGITANNQRLNPMGSMSFPLIMAKTPFTPRIDFPTSTTSGSFHFRFGGEVWGISPGGQVYGQFSRQSYPNHDRTLSAFGYLYLQNKLERNAIMDMASEKEIPVFEEDKNLSLSYLTNDVFSVSAQGLSGTFRPFRTDIGIVHNENQNENDNGGSFGGEIHSGAYFHGGIDVTANLTSTYSGEWHDNNEISHLLKFNQSNNGLPVYFKNVGETNVFLNEDDFNKLGGFEPVSFSIGESILRNSLNGRNLTPEDQNKVAESRNTNFHYLTAADAELAKIPFSTYDGHDKTKLKQTLARVSGYRKENHISYITITKDDGTIYEFGIAAYNTFQKEVSFNVDGKPEDQLYTKNTSYNENVDNTPNNRSGLSHIYTSTETPAYAYAYLLTAVYSPDYQDLTGDGPTPDDLGKYTKFNYTLEYTDFKWRTPYENANYNPGFLCDKEDDMASYIYGTKEIWMINSIETKNYTAEFFSSKRHDAFEVNGENGGIKADGKQLFEIDSVKLFSRVDYNKSQDPIPVKSVFFKYNYKLCPNLPSNENSLNANDDSTTGKLTLEKLYFSYDKSQKEKNSYYVFKYNNEKDAKYKYDEAALDRWGTFKEKPVSNKFNNLRFPYAEQNLISANEQSQAWQLNKIVLPTGGVLKIEYEAKDYAFVQNKASMQMFKIVGFSKDNTIAPDLSNVTKNLYNDDKTSNNYLIVDLQNTVTKQSINKYFQPGEKLYINCVVSIGKIKDISKVFANEEVSGYFDVEPGEFEPVGQANPKLVKIKLKIDGNSNPISRALWQKMSKSLTKVLYPPAITNPSGDIAGKIVQVVGSLPDVLFGFLKFLKSWESTMMDDERGKRLDNNIGSYVRLYNPDGRKFGGGSRVKKITLFDSWDKMTGEPLNENFYGQEYSYNKTVISGKDTSIISSGVATYEPIGNEENPFVMPSESFNSSNALAPELYYYKMEPFGESFFPAASVGYSEVKVSDIHDSKVNKNATGFELYQFYTSKDFPIITKRTIKQGIPRNVSNPFVNQKKYTASQGFSIEINDMNGKLRSHKIFSQLDFSVPVSGIEYKYKTTGNALENHVNAIDPLNGEIKNKMVGLDFDFYVATAESRSLTRSPALQLNIDVIPAFLGIPFPFPSFLPSYSENLLQYKGVTTTKLIYKTGLIDTTISYDNGLQTTSHSVLYDAVSGNVVISATENEYNEPVYKTKLPAYWFYPAMGPASTNANTVLHNFNTAAINTNASFNEGDELQLDGKKGWVFQNKNSVNSKSIIDEAGNLLLGTFSEATLIRSGKKNIQSVISEEITSKLNPISTGKLKFVDVIDASATKFKEYWQSYYGVHPMMAKDSCICYTLHFSLPDAIQLNFDGSVRSPINASIDGSVITIKNDSCEIKIQLDRGVSNLLLSVTRVKIVFDSLTAVAVPGFCQTSFRAEGRYRIIDSFNRVRQQGRFTLDNNCCPTIACHKISEHIENPLICNIGDGQAVNPYLLGILGNWREDTTFNYIIDRSYKSNHVQSNLGLFKKFSLCVQPPENFTFGTPVNRNEWQPKNITSIVDPHGMTIETLNALKIPKSEILGYAYSLPIAIAENAHYYEVAFDGFEDYDYLKQINSPLSECKLPDHFRFEKFGAGSSIIDTLSHTGKRSLLVAKGDQVSLERAISLDCTYPFIQTDYISRQYFLRKCDIIKPFSPQIGNEYILSLWVNEPRSTDQLDESIGVIKLQFLDGQTEIGSLTLKATGPIIDNWQQLSGSFKVPAGSKTFKIMLTTENTKMFIDDIRIEPFNGSMKAYVYDPIKLKLMAVLNEQNYATFYEYDAEGQLTRIKKETEKGIVTIEEIRNAKPKIDKLKFP